MKNYFKIIIVLLGCGRLGALSLQDIAQVENEWKKAQSSAIFANFDLLEKFQKATPNELRAINTEISTYEQRKFYGQFSQYIRIKMRESYANGDFQEYLSLMKTYLRFSYMPLTGIRAEKNMVIDAFKVFNAPKSTGIIRQNILDLLKKHLAMPTAENYREYPGNGMVFFDNRLLFNRFGVMAMELLLQNKSIEETDRIFKQQIGKISDELQIKTLNAVVEMRDGNKVFYWVMLSPVGVFFCDQTTIWDKCESGRPAIKPAKPE
ncbi:MAG: hypothetical protein LBM70_10620 [Victivallales bacterium]|nr:hypothetical protein [Victivallales bacterium]